MSILGFSHIVTEVADLEQSRSFYEQLGYDLIYAFEENVPQAKHTILKGNPDTIQLIYQKHPGRASLGIELISHSTHGVRGIKPAVAYGWLNDSGKKEIYTDPDGNSLISFSAPKIKCAQHIFVPVTSQENSKNFYKKFFRFNEVNLDGFPNEIYNELYKNVSNVIVLGLPSCLSENWNACLHLIEVPSNNAKRYLNDCHFSCFCLLIDEVEFLSFLEKKIQIVGPFQSEKTIQGNKSVFTIGFIQDPDGFLVEFYIPGQIQNVAKLSSKAS